MAIIRYQHGGAHQRKLINIRQRKIAASDSIGRYVARIGFVAASALNNVSNSTRLPAVEAVAAARRIKRKV